MKSNHTQGEWKKHKVNSYGKEWFEIHWSKDGECVAEIVHNESDADLLAASKDMYEALKSIVFNLSLSGGVQYDIVKSALAKAEGNI